MAIYRDIGWYTALLVVACLTSGCTTTLTDQGAVYLQFGTRIEVGHQTSTTETKSEAAFRSQPFEAWLLDANSNGVTP